MPPIIPDGGNAASQNAYTGQPREITVDTSNQQLRLHDGSTPGGHRILNRDDNDSRYQARSEELDGLIGFEPSNRGLLVRLGPSTYRLRSLTVNLQNLEIENSDGYDGNPLIGLASTIESDHTWNGGHTFSQQIQANGGVKGDLEGNTTGNHTGDVVGNVTGNLDGNATGNHSGSFTGSADFSDGTLTFAPGQIPLSALNVDILNHILVHSVPIGAAIPFHGDVVDIPLNYALCDGTNGTPDYRDRFVLCAGPVNAAGSFGGTTQHIHGITIEAGGAHAHTGSTGGTSLTEAQMPAHRHANGVTDAGNTLYNHGNLAANPTTSRSIDGNSSDGVREGWTTTVGDGDPHDHSVTINDGGSHTHTGSAANATHIPPFYSSIWIMRIS